MTLAHRRAAQVTEVTGTKVDDDTILSVILAGLLDEFSDIKLSIEQSNNAKLKAAKKTLVDHAESRNLLDLTKGGNSVRSKTFNIQAQGNGRQGAYRDWARGKCSGGQSCKYMYSHDGPGGYNEFGIYMY